MRLQRRRVLRIICSANGPKLLNKKPYPLPAAIQNVYDLDVGKDPKMHHIGPMEPWDLHYLSENRRQRLYRSTHTPE